MHTIILLIPSLWELFNPIKPELIVTYFPGHLLGFIESLIFKDYTASLLKLPFVFNHTVIIIISILNIYGKTESKSDTNESKSDIILGILLIVFQMMVILQNLYFFNSNVISVIYILLQAALNLAIYLIILYVFRRKT